MSSNMLPSQTKIHSLIPPWLRGNWGLLGILFIIHTLLNLAWTYFHWGGEAQVNLCANLFSFAPSLFAAILAWRAAAQKSLSKQMRQAWLILGSSFFMFLIGNVIWAYLQLISQVEPFPSLADVFYLAFYPLALWGLLSIPTIPSTSHPRRDLLTLGLDLVSVFTVATLFVGYFIILPTAATSNDLGIQLIGAAYPFGSLIVIGGILAVLYRHPSPNTESTLAYLLIGMLFFVGADIAFGYTSIIGTYSSGNWTDVSWNVAQLFFGLAALHNIYYSSASNSTQGFSTLRRRYLIWLPPVAMGMGYGLILYLLLISDGKLDASLLFGAFLLTMLFLTRQIVSPSFADLPIRAKMLLTFIVVSVLSVGLVAAGGYFTIHSNLEAVVGQHLKEGAELHSRTLGNEVSKQLDLMKSLELGETIEYGVSVANTSYRGDRTAIEEQLRRQDAAWKTTPDSDPMVISMLKNPMAQKLVEFYTNFPSHSDLLVTDEYGRTIAATTRPSHYLQVNEGWWQAAYNRGQGAYFISQPRFDPYTQDLNVIIAMPVHANHSSGKVIGVLGTTYHVRNILKILAFADPTAKDGFDLLLPDGQLLTEQGVLRNLDPLTVATLQANRESNAVDLDFEGSLKVVSQARIVSSNPEENQLFQDLNWYLIMHEDYSTAFAPLRTAARTVFFTTFLVLLLTIGVAMILAQLLVLPISRLTHAAAQIKQGNLDVQEQVESRDEIGTLANTFNQMLAVLSQTQKNLRESEAHYRNLVDYSPDMIAVHSDGKYVFINPAGVKLLGAKQATEVIGRNTLDLIPPQAHDFVAESIEQAILSGEATSLRRQKMFRIDGTSFEAEYRAIPLTFAGKPAIQIVTRDITERKQAEEKIRQLLTEVAAQKSDLECRVRERTEELNTLNQQLQNELIERQQLMLSLRESEERFRILFDYSPDAIFLIDPHSSDILWPVVDCNQAAGEMNGYSREELIGQSMDLLNEKKGNRDDFVAALENLRQHVVLRGVETTHLHQDGHAFPIEYSTALIKVGDHEHILGIDRDITERKQAEAALSQAIEAAEKSRRVAETANRAKSEFLSRMSHELRTPMNAILGFAQLLEISQREPLTTGQKERVRQIIKGGQHLLDLINEILDISRIEANRLRISPEPVSVRESIREVFDLTVPLAVKRQIQLVAKLGKMDVDPFVLADRQRLNQVLLNLVGNAVKYSYDGSSIIVTCQQTSSNQWRISISDTGHGISQENLARLFMPFERLDSGASYVEGTGLGLVVAKRLIELMQGYIGVESMLGRGSTFWIELPMAERPAEILQRMGGTKELPPLSVNAQTILYVEDNVSNFELIQQVLADYKQIELLWANDAKSGLEMAQYHLPNLVLLDLHLGNSDGTEVLCQLKQAEKTKNIPVIVVTADAISGQNTRLVRMGADACLTKPLNVKQLMILMEELLSRKKL